MKNLDALKNNKVKIKSLFKSKETKINKITELTENMKRLEMDINCIDKLFRTIILQLNHGAINFFKREKFTTYQKTINTFATA